MADEIVHEYEFKVPNAYLVLPIFKQVLANGTDTTLLYVIYTIISVQFSHSTTEGNRYKAIGCTHFWIFIFMVLWGIADASLYSYTQVYTVTHDGGNPTAINLSNWYRRIHMSYVSIYCAVSLEMFACALFIFKQSRPRTRVSLSCQKTPIFC